MSLESLIPEIANSLVGFGIGLYFGYTRSEYSEEYNLTKDLADKIDKEIMDQKEIEKISKLAKKVVEINKLVAGFGGAAPAVIANLLGFYSPPQFVRCFSLALIAGVAGCKLGHYIGRKIKRREHLKVGNEIEEKIKDMENGLKEGRYGKADMQNLIASSLKKAKESGMHILYTAYYMNKFKDAVKNALLRVRVEEFFDDIRAEEFQTEIIGVPEHKRGYLFLFDKDRLVTADAKIGYLKAIRIEDEAEIIAKPDIRVDKQKKWDGNVDDIVNDIQMKMRDHTIVLAGGGEYMPSERRLGIAAIKYISGYYVWTQKEIEKK